VAVLIVILALACVFYAYCAVQFGRELKRSRNRLTCYGLLPADTRSVAKAIEIPGRAIVLQMPQPKLVGTRPSLDPEFGARENPAVAQAILRYQKSRISIFPSETGPRAEKRAAER